MSRSAEARQLANERRADDRERTIVRNIERARKVQFGGAW